MGRLNVSKYVQTKYYTVIFSALSALVGSLVHTTANAGLNDWNFQYHGFFSQSYTKSVQNNFFGTSSGAGSFAFRELGLNASVRPLPNVQTAVQALYREAGGSDTGEPRVDFFVVDYRPVNAEAFNFGVRAGRIKNPLGLYNDTRDVAFTRPSVVLPQSIYFDRVRDLGLSSDGAQLYFDSRSPWGEIGLQLHAAKPRFSDDTEVALFSANLPGTLDADTSYMWRLVSELFDGQVKFAVSQAFVNMSYHATTNESNGNSALSFDPIIVSLQMRAQNWGVTTEYARRRFKFDNMAVPNKQQTGESYYVQLHYVVVDNIRLFGRYDTTYLNVQDRNGEDYAVLTNGTRPAFSQFSKDAALGAQLETGKNWLFMIEQHWVEGTAWLPFQDNPDQTSLQRKWWMFNLLVSYRF